MPSSYPGDLDSLPTSRTDDTVAAVNHAADHNNANDAINKIEAELGVNPSGSSGTVQEALSGLAGGATGEVLTKASNDANDYGWEAGGGGGSHSVLASSTAEVAVTNTVAESDLLRFTIPGGTLAAGDIVRLTAFGRSYNNTGILYPNGIIRAYLGATELFEWDDTQTTFFGAGSASGELFSWRLALDVAIRAAAVQATTGSLVASAAVTNGTGSDASDRTIYAPSTENTAVNKDLAVTFEMGAADANLSVYRDSYMIEHISP